MALRQPILAVVPARGGSVGVIRKNMRSVAGCPLIGHTLMAVRASGLADRIVVSSEDEEILNWAELRGYEPLPRPESLSGPSAPIGQVAAHVADELQWTGIVAVFQPTSPLRSGQSIRDAVRRFFDGNADSLMSVVREPHLYWYDEGDDLSCATPLFGERVNRQYGTHRVLRETGSIQLVRSEHVRRHRTMVAPRHLLFELPADEGLDIDTVDDLAAARRRLERGTVVLRLRANAVVGSGHLHHCIQLAEELSDQQVRFLLTNCDPFVDKILDMYGYEYRRETSLGDDLAALRGPGSSIVVNDVLDTSVAEIMVERSLGFSVVNVEDLGPGARYADWVINALYPPPTDSPAHTVYGARWATLRTEFHNLPARRIRPIAKRILVTFGGTDPASLGPRFAKALALRFDLEVVAVAGPGADEARFPPECRVRTQLRSMAHEMMAADVVVTSAGRTVFEAAATGTPVIVVAQNAREATHAHIGFDSGVIFLGLGPLVGDQLVVEAVDRLLADSQLREELSARLRQSIDLLGTERIGSRIRSMLRGH